MAPTHARHHDDSREHDSRHEDHDQRAGRSHLLRPLLTPPARSALGDRFDAWEIRGIVRDAFADYDRRRAALPSEEQSGARLMVQLAALTAGFYRALLGRGLAEHDARRRTARVTWLVYEKMAAVPFKRVGRGKPSRRSADR